MAMHIAAMDPSDEKELLEQPFIKNGEKVVNDIIKELIAKLGENIKVGKFVRLSI